MRNTEISTEMKVRIAKHADFKYNNRRSGVPGEVKDVYESDHSGEVIAEVEFGGERAGYELVRPGDLEKAE